MISFVAGPKWICNSMRAGRFKAESRVSGLVVVMMRTRPSLDPIPSITFSKTDKVILFGPAFPLASSSSSYHYLH